MFKWITRISAVLILSLSSVAVFAQDTAPEATAIFCGDLAQADCELLQNSAEAMKNLSSASFNFSVEVAVSDADTTEPHTLSLEGEGSFAGLPTELMNMHTLSGDTNPTAMFIAMGAAIRSFEGDLTLTVNLPPALLQHMPSDVKLPETITMQVRMVDGVAYLNTETLKPLLEGMGMGENLPPRLQGWIGIDVIEAITAMMKSNPEMMSQMSAGMMNADANPSAMFGDPSAFLNAVKIERGDDQDGAATFTATLDFAALAADPAFADMIRAQMEKQGEEISDEALQMGLDMVAQAGNAIQFSATEMIDLETGFIRSVTVNISLDASQLPHDSSDNAPTMFAMENAKISLVATVSLDDFNSAPEISAPEDAIILPPEFLERMSKGMMQGILRGDFGNSDAVPAEATAEATRGS